jgi:YD repeat-containing protein
VSTFDALGNRLTISYPGGRVVTTTYDALDRASVITDTTGAVATIKYIGPDRVERIDYGNGTRCDITWNGIDGVPNAPGDFGWRRIARARHTHVASGTVIDDRTFAWDRNQNKTQRKDLRATGPQLTHDYTNDQLDRLIATQVTTPGPVPVRQTTYTLDGVDNRINVAGPGTADPGPYVMSAINPPADAQMNQYTNSPLGPHLYDANGNQTARGGVNYVYDYRNRLVAITGIPVPESHEYDPLGRRVKRIAGAVTTQFTYTGCALISEAPGVGAARDFVGFVRCVDVDEDGYGDGTAGQVCAIRGPVDAWLHTDDLGSTMALSNAAGAAIERVEYADYGAPEFFTAAGAPLPASATGNPWLFGGMRYENETGLYYTAGRPVEIKGNFDGDASNTNCSLRMLDPKTGQTLQSDPRVTRGNARIFRGANPWSR